MADQTAVPIDAWHLALSGLLVLAAGVVSVALRLNIERRLLAASVRTVVQLLLVGYVLGWVFALREPLLVFALAMVMIGMASRAAVQRSSRRYRGAHGVAFATLTLTGLLTTLCAARVILDVTPWWRPQYVVPLLGMVLGNGLTGISLCLDDVLASFDERRAQVEAELALGASRWEAARDPLRSAVRRGLIPIINAMTVAGVVSLPGMMTGQILGGTDPLLAVRYQIVIMFMIAGATSFGCMLLGLATYRRLFNARHQLRAERIERAPS